MIDLIGGDEGLQLFDELQVQNGAKSVSERPPFKPGSPITYIARMETKLR